MSRNLDIRIPYNGYFRGKRNLEFEIPWITPGSTYRLDELQSIILPWKITAGGTRSTNTSINIRGSQNRTRHNFRAIEFGSGGSTLFLARRCKSVLSFENARVWRDKIDKVLEEKSITNVVIRGYETYERLKGLIEEVEDGRFNCALIDNKWKIMSRDEALDIMIPKMAEKAILVLDNYASEASFPDSYNLTINEFIDKKLDSSWIGEEFNSSYWGGLGTRIFHRNIVKRADILIPNSNTIHVARWFNA